MKTKILVDFKICSSVPLTFNDVTSLTNLITFFVLILLHAVSKIGMYGWLYILNAFSCRVLVLCVSQLIIVWHQPKN